MSDKCELILILGGARSGKSAYAEKLARERGGDEVVFLATSEAGDEEMHARIEEHRAHRSDAWQTIEAPREIARALQHAKLNARVVLLDCLTLLATNILLANESNARAMLDRELDDLLAWQRARAVDLIIISNEVGMGIVPDNRLAREFRDLLGAANQRVAALAHRVIFMIAGIPLEIKHN